MEGINQVLHNNNLEMQNIIALVNVDAIDKGDLVLRLSMIHASNRTLEVITAPKEGSVVSSKSANKEIKPLFVEEAEPDDPEQEDREVKKQREEDRRFFG